MTTANLRERGGLVGAAASSLGRGTQNISTAAQALGRVIAEDSWREFVTQDGRHVTPRSFAEFVTTPPLCGLGADLDLVKRVIGGDTRLQDRVDELVANPHGTNQYVEIDNINLHKHPDGTSKDQALRRLRQNAPELHEQVLSGELSAHAAMVQAGFRRKTMTVPVDDPASFIRAGLRRFTAEELLAALAAQQ